MECERVGPAFFQSWDEQHYKPLPKSFRTTDGSFVVAGLPKSGNVWLTALIASALGLPTVKTKGKCHVYYVHQSLSETKLLTDSTVYRGAVIVRDLRDIVVSLYHWLKTEDYLRYYKHGPHQVFDDYEAMYIEYFLRRFAKIDIPNQMDGYVTRGWPVVKYERLFDQPKRELTRLFKVWQVDIEESAIDAAIERCSLQNMRSNSAGLVDDTIASDHFRVGGYGHFKSELPDIVLKDIETRYGSYLRSWGYETTN